MKKLLVVILCLSLLVTSMSFLSLTDLGFAADIDNPTGLVVGGATTITNQGAIDNDCGIPLINEVIFEVGLSRDKDTYTPLKNGRTTVVNKFKKKFIGNGGNTLFFITPTLYNHIKGKFGGKFTLTWYNAGNKALETHNRPDQIDRVKILNDSPVNPLNNAAFPEGGKYYNNFSIKYNAETILSLKNGGWKNVINNDPWDGRQVWSWILQRQSDNSYKIDERLRQFLDRSGTLDMNNIAGWTPAQQWEHKLRVLDLLIMTYEMYPDGSPNKTDWEHAINDWIAGTNLVNNPITFVITTAVAVNPGVPIANTTGHLIVRTIDYLNYVAAIEPSYMLNGWNYAAVEAGTNPPGTNNTYKNLTGSVNASIKASPTYNRITNAFNEYNGLSYGLGAMVKYRLNTGAGYAQWTNTSVLASYLDVLQIPEIQVSGFILGLTAPLSTPELKIKVTAKPEEKILSETSKTIGDVVKLSINSSMSTEEIGSWEPMLQQLKTEGKQLSVTLAITRDPTGGSYTPNYTTPLKFTPDSFKTFLQGGSSIDITDDVSSTPIKFPETKSFGYDITMKVDFTVNGTAKQITGRDASVAKFKAGEPGSIVTKVFYRLYGDSGNLVKTIDSATQPVQEVQEGALFDVPKTITNLGVIYTTNSNVVQTAEGETMYIDYFSTTGVSETKINVYYEMWYNGAKVHTTAVQHNVPIGSQFTIPKEYTYSGKIYKTSSDTTQVAKSTDMYIKYALNDINVYYVLYDTDDNGENGKLVHTTGVMHKIPVGGAFDVPNTYSYGGKTYTNYGETSMYAGTSNMYIRYEYRETKILMTYVSEPQTWAEIKQGKPYSESFEVMAGVPTTETLYFGAGGSEFMVEIELEYKRNVEAERTYKSKFNGVDCEFKDGDTYKGNNSGYKESSTMVTPGAGGGTLTYNITPNDHGSSTTVWAQWTGTIRNNTVDPGIVGFSAGSAGSTCAGAGFTPGNVGTMGTLTNNWDMSEYNAAVEAANAWAAANNGKVFIKIADSDEVQREWASTTSSPTGKIYGDNAAATAPGAGYTYNAGTPSSYVAPSGCPHDCTQVWDIPPKPASGTPGQPGYTPAEPGVPHVHNHNCGSFTPAVKSTTSKVADKSFTIRVEGGTMPAHYLCGPCCNHVLPAVQDTWVQKSSFDHIKINSVHIWKLDQAAVNGMTEITGTDEIKASIVQGDSNYFLNISTQNKSIDGRLRYSVEPRQHDTVVWEEGTRSNKCNGIVSNTANTKPVTTNGHQSSWATGILYNNTGYTDEVNYHRDRGGTSTTTNNVADTKDVATTEWARFNQRRTTQNVMTVISDVLILQTSSGDQSVIYFQKDSVPRQTQEHYTEASRVAATKEEMWDNNPNSAAKWTKTHINIGSYNGNYASPNTKYQGNGGGINVPTKFDVDPAATITRPTRPSQLFIYKDNISQIRTNRNKSYITGEAQTFWRNVYNYPSATGTIHSASYKSKFGANGYVMGATYSPNHSKINDIVVHNPVSAENAVVVGLPEDRDQRSTMPIGAAQESLDGQNKLNICPRDPGLCEFRVLNCTYFQDRVLAAFDFEGSARDTVNDVTYTLPAGFTIENVNRFGTGGSLSAKGTRWSIPFTDLGLTYEPGTKLYVEADYYIPYSATTSTMLAGFYSYNMYLPAASSTPTWNTGNGWERRADVNITDKNIKIGIEFDFSDTNNCKLFINGVEHTAYTRLGASSPINAESVGDLLNIGSWGVSDGYPANFYIDNLRIIKRGGTSYHTATCYKPITFHPEGMNKHIHTTSCMERSSGSSNTFSYTGGVQEYTAPYTGVYEIEAWGAQGGGASYTVAGGYVNPGTNTGVGGKGGYSKGSIVLKEGEKIYIYVGGSGQAGNGTGSYSGGFNGGGKGQYYGAGGGGATDVRVQRTKTYSNWSASNMQGFAPADGASAISTSGGNLVVPNTSGGWEVKLPMGGISARDIKQVRITLDNNTNGTGFGVGHDTQNEVFGNLLANTANQVLTLNPTWGDVPVTNLTFDLPNGISGTNVIVKKVEITVNERVIVAGGGGGATVYTTVGYKADGGAGGGTTGGNGTTHGAWTTAYSTTGGTQSAGGTGNGWNYPGSLGNGGNAANNYIGGGGGGYYGGAAGTYHGYSGAGGSGYVGGVINGTMQSGVQSGDGKVVIKEPSKSGMDYVLGLVQARDMAKLKEVLGPTYADILSGELLHTWTFSGSDTKGFSALNNSTVSVSSNQLVFNITGTDPQAQVPVNIDAEAVTNIKIYFDNYTSSTVGTLLWGLASRPNGEYAYHSDRALAWNMQANTAGQVVTIDTTSNPNWKGLIDTLRWDFADWPNPTSGSVRITKIELRGFGELVSSGSGGGSAASKTFNNTSSGMYGANTNNSSGTLGGTISMSSGMYLWTVPETGSYSIATWGAGGGGRGGKGAYVKGDFQLNAGEVLVILVGQSGGSAEAGGGGGGATYVAKGNSYTTATPLIVAAGGGGYSGSGSGGAGSATLTTDGTGGSYCRGSHPGGSGGGFNNNGTSAYGGGGYSFRNGGSGGYGHFRASEGIGGFGGGGGNGWWGGGGGGGYKGGGNGATDGIGGGGGLSYNVGTNQEGTSGVKTGHGQVVITKLFTPVKIVSDDVVDTAAIKASIIANYDKIPDRLPDGSVNPIWVCGLLPKNIHVCNTTCYTSNVLTCSEPHHTTVNGDVSDSGIWRFSGNVTWDSTKNAWKAVGSSSMYLKPEYAPKIDPNKSYIVEATILVENSNNKGFYWGGDRLNASKGHLEGFGGTYDYSAAVATVPTPGVWTTYRSQIKTGTSSGYTGWGTDTVYYAVGGLMNYCWPDPSTSQITYVKDIKFYTIDGSDMMPKGTRAETLHYDGSNDICWDACGIDANHAFYKPVVTTPTGDNIPNGKFVNIDWPFQIYFPNQGNFDQGQVTGLSTLTTVRGKGYTDNMDTTKWTKAKRVKFSFNVVFEGDGKLYRAGEWIELPVTGTTYPYYNFYCVLANYEAKSATVEYEVEADNCFGNNDNLYFDTNKNRHSDFTAYHGAYESSFIDVVGRIGNLVIDDTGDYRFSNFFKVPVSSDDWIIDGVVKNVNSELQNNYMAWGTDLRGLAASSATGWFDTYGTQPWLRKEPVTLPLSPEKNNILPLKNQPMRPGYDVLMDISTIGNYRNKMQIVPYYYAFDLVNSTLTPVDVYVASNGQYKPINIFDIVQPGWSAGGNMVGGSTEIGAFESAGLNGVSIVDAALPGSGGNVRALRLNKNANVPVTWVTGLKLTGNVNYTIEFDYWADADNVKFEVDLWPDDLPQKTVTANKQLQHMVWDVNSSSSSLDDCRLRFFNDITIPNPANIYITNIKLTNGIYPYVMNLDWVNEAARRNYGTAEGMIEKEHTDALAAIYSELIKTPDSTGEMIVTGLREMDRPVGKYYSLGTAQVMVPSGRARTFIGSETTNGVNRNIGNRIVAEDWWYAAQRWHFKIGLPSSAVFVEHGKKATADEVQRFATPNHVILMTADIQAVGDTFVLRYEHGNANGTINLGGKTYAMPPSIPPVISVYSAHKSSVQDIDVRGTH